MYSQPNNSFYNSLSVSGIGFGVTVLSTQIFIMTYFEKLRGTAYGISTIGVTIAGFVFPKLMLYFKDTYGLQWTMLLMGALLINLTPLSVLLKMPSWSRKKTRHERTQDLVWSVYITEPNGEIEEPSQEASSSTSKGTLRTDVLKLARMPIFYLITFSAAVVFVNDIVFLSTMVDFALDNGISMTDAVWLTSCFGATDILGRLFLPVLADRGYLRRTTLLTLTLLLMGSVLTVAPYATTYWTIGAVIAVTTALSACGILMHDVILVDNVGVRRIALAHGIIGIVKAAPMLSSPAIIGQFTYNND